MGRLTITPVTRSSSSASTSTIATQSSEQSTVYAEIKINAQTYKYEIGGVSLPLEDIPRDLPALVPRLEFLLRNQRYKPEQYTDTEYGTPRKLTFSAQGQPSQSQVIVSSARAFLELLDKVRGGQGSDIQILMINDKAQFYINNRSSWIFTPALEQLSSICPKIKLKAFPALEIFDLYIASDSAKVVNGVTTLFKNGCFPHLNTLYLHVSGFCRPAKHRKEGWLFTNDTERVALYNFYLNGLINAPTSPKLEHLHLPLWCAKGTELGLAVLQRFYANLKTLTVDMIIPTAVSKGARLYSSSTFTTSTTLPNGYGYTTNTYTLNTEEHAVEFRIPEPEEVADQPTLLTLLEEMKDVSQLECLEVYDWPIKENIVPECNTLQTAITNGWLPKLNSIALRFNIVERSNYLLETTIERKTATDTSSLLEAVIEAKVPLKKLQLIMPEKNGYQGWLDEMTNGSFFELEQFHYRLPDRWLGEQDPAYHARVEKALDTIHTAVRKGQLPKLKVFIVEGNQAIQMKRNIEAPPLPKHIWTKVDVIEEAVLAQPSAPSQSLFNLEQELTMDTSPMILHNLESSQAV
jgi:hypothetical protein